MQLDLSEEVVEDSSTSLHLDKSESTALKVNNNILNSWDGFWMSMEKLFVEPALQLQWIDFSFNDLKTIDAVSSASVLSKWASGCYYYQYYAVARNLGVIYSLLSKKQLHN